MKGKTVQRKSSSSLGSQVTMWGQDKDIVIVCEMLQRNGLKKERERGTGRMMCKKGWDS